MAQSKITYNGVTLTYVGSKTLATAGKVMTTDMTIEPVVLSESKTAYAVTTTATVVTPSAGKDALSQVTIGKITSSNLTAANIKAGTTVTVNNGNANIYSINGTFTSDANATASDILEGKTAYVNGAKVTGSLSTGSYKEEIGAPGAGEIGMTYSVAGDTVTVYVQNKAAFFAEGSCTYTIPNILPDFPDKDAQAAYILTGYQAYSETGSSIVGTMVDNSGGDTKTVSLTISNNAGTTPVAGYYKSGSQVVASPGTVVSSSATITTASVAWNSTNSNWDVTGSKAISAPSVSKTGYISSSVGTKTGSTAYLSATLPVVAIQASATAASLNPALSRITKPAAQTWVDAAAGAAVTTTTASIVYVGVNMAAATVTPTIAATVTTAGYGTTAHYSASTSQAKVDVAAKNVYVPVTTSTYTVAASASATITVGNPVYQSSGTNSGKFTVAGNATGYADATANVANAGWISSGSKNATQVTGATSTTLVLNKVGVTATVSGTLTQKPTIATNTVATGVTNAASGAATTSTPSSGVYVAVKSAAKTGSITATGSVNAAGYGTTTQYTAGSASATVGADASDVTYIPITTKGLANPSQAITVVTSSAAVTPTIASGQGVNAALRITATETQTAGWTSGTASTLTEIPIYIEDFHA